MSTVMKASEFVKRLKDIASNYKTLYVMGCIGAPMTAANKTRYINHHPYNQKPARVKMINAASADTFGFDCVCLIKSVLWGWNGDKKKTYGGAKYRANGVPDINADAMINACSGISTNFDDIQVGEAVWGPGHIGVYIGDGLAVECTPAWKNKVQITACNCTKSGYNTRNWKKHGKLPYIEYDVQESCATKTEKKSVDEIAREVIQGKWYTGAARRSALTKAGYNYAEVQKRVDEILAPSKRTNEDLAREVIQGKWGVGTDRKNRLTKAGYNYAAIQRLVNKMM